MAESGRRCADSGVEVVAWVGAAAGVLLSSLYSALSTPLPHNIAPRPSTQPPSQPLSMLIQDL
ncbi:hypothetical protein J6590_051655 [Homalodisca vitripennis]|nr:hypothetical protein J6590_051655 [Homalodisca vitripennis]